MIAVITEPTHTFLKAVENAFQSISQSNKTSKASQAFNLGVEGNLDFELKKVALARVMSLGLPKISQEEFRKSNIFSATKHVTNLSVSKPSRDLKVQDVVGFFPDTPAFKIVLHNGKLCEHLSNLTELQSLGVQLRYVDIDTQKLTVDPQLLGKFNPSNMDFVTALSVSLSNIALEVRIGKKVEVPHPIFLLNLQELDLQELDLQALDLQEINTSKIRKEDSNNSKVSGLSDFNPEFFRGFFNAPIFVVHLEKDAKCQVVINHQIKELIPNPITLIEPHLSLKTEFFHLPLELVELEESAHLKFTRTSTDSIFNFNSRTASKTYCSLQSRSFLSFHDVSFGSTSQHKTLDFFLDGQKAETRLNQVILAAEKNNVCTNTTVFHNQPETFFKQQVKTIVDHKAVASFQGNIIVPLNSQKIKSVQINKNMLLSTEAKVYTKPQLQIQADDVVCSHGATVGALDPLELFYLQSRGIGLKDAIALLTSAFVEDQFESLDHEAIRDFIKTNTHSELLKHSKYSETAKVN